MNQLVIRELDIRAVPGSVAQQTEEYMHHEWIQYDR
jgi:hypothetical protein